MVRALLFAFLVFTPLYGGTLFTDTFAAGASPLWSNQRGNWAVDDYGYFAQNPGAGPLTATLLPFVVSDFVLDLDITFNNDEGIWLRSDASANAGVVLIIRSYDIYWHVILDAIEGPWEQYGWSSHTLGGDLYHVTITGQGNLLKAYLNERVSPTTTLDLTSFTHDYSTGRVGLYSYSGVRFNNVVLSGDLGTPEPGSAILLCLGGVFIVLRRKRALK